jgi:hypothetical protein
MHEHQLHETNRPEPVFACGKSIKEFWLSIVVLPQHGME